MKLLAISLVASLPCLLAQTITTSAGNTTWGTANGVAVDSAGNQYVSDSARHVVHKVDRLGSAIIVAGSGVAGYSGDGAAATSARLTTPQGVALGLDGSIYIADTGNRRIRKVAPNGTITTVAGSGAAGFGGDGGPATSAIVGSPVALALDGAGNLYFTGANRIRRVTPAGIISTVAGTGSGTHSGDGGPPLLAGMDPEWLTFGPDGAMYFTDDTNRRVRKISNNVVSTVAGTGSGTLSGDGGPATAAGLRSARGIAVDSTGNVYVADYWSARVRRVAPSGIITTYAGNGRSATSGDNGPATAAGLYGPLGLAVDASGSLFIADGNWVRKVAPVGPPALTSASPAFLGKTGISANMYLEIYGSNLAGVSRTWTSADFNGPSAPTALDGSRVSVNGIPAFVYYAGPNQININVPDDTATGPVAIEVTTPTGSSNTLTVNRGRVSPALQTTPLFLVGGNQYVVAQTIDFNSFIGKPGMISGVAFTPARPGQTVIIYALGLGPTVPATRAGEANSVNAALALPFQVLVGGKTARVGFAGMVGNSIGLYQLNVEIPDLPAGDHPIELTVDGVSNAQNLVISMAGANPPATPSK